MPSQTGYFDTLKSVAGKIFTFSKTITLTSPDDTSVITLPAGTKTVPPTTDIIKGDGTAGRVLRHSRISIFNGTDASTLKCTLANVWNGDAIAETDNVAKNATTGNFYLSIDGEGLKILNTGLQGDLIDIISVFLHYNASGVPLFIRTEFNASGILIWAKHNTTNVGQDWTVLVDTGGIFIDLVYITSE